MVLGRSLSGACLLHLSAFKTEAELRLGGTVYKGEKDGWKEHTVEHPSTMKLSFVTFLALVAGAHTVAASVCCSSVPAGVTCPKGLAAKRAGIEHKPDGITPETCCCSAPSGQCQICVRSDMRCSGVVVD